MIYVQENNIGIIILTKELLLLHLYVAVCKYLRQINWIINTIIQWIFIIKYFRLGLIWLYTRFQFMASLDDITILYYISISDMIGEVDYKVVCPNASIELIKK